MRIARQGQQCPTPDAGPENWPLGGAAGSAPAGGADKDKLSSILPAKLALKFDCPLVPVQVKRIGVASYRLIFHPPITPRDTSASEDDQALDMIQQLHGQFEEWIREEPADWLCSKRLWWKKKRRYDNSKKAHLRKIAKSAAGAENENDVKSNAA